MQEQEVNQRVIQAAQETKAREIILIDMENRSPFTDYVLICSGRSQAHVRGIADNIESSLREAGIRVSAQEGHQEGSWVLMDFGTVIVHVFHPETRSFYNLEELLADYPRQDFPSDDDTQEESTISAGPTLATARS